MLGLAALAALMAMAFVGASSAMAESTTLCTGDGSGPCGITHVHEESVGKEKLLSSITVECNVLFLGDALSGLASPLAIHGTFTYTNCGSCTIEEENGPAEIKVLKEGHETAKVTGEYLFHVECGGFIDCNYNSAGLKGTAKGPLLSTQKNGEVTISGQTTNKETGGFLCPATSKLDITTTPLGATYISSSSFPIGPTKGEQEGLCNDAEVEMLKCLFADPVNAATGNLTEEQTDIPALGGRGPALEVTRSYNSQLAASQKESGPFGYGWTGPYSATLEFGAGGLVATVRQDSGATAVFYEKEKGKYAPPAWGLASLKASGENWIFTLPNQEQLEFNKAGQLTKVTDRHKNAIALAYKEGHLETVEDAAKRKLAFTFSEGHVTSVKDPLEHEVKYAYESGNLTKVTLPGETEPNWKFSYNAEHELTKATDGRGNTTTTEYDEKQRVTWQKDPLEHKTSFEYKEKETTITMPNGSKTVETYNQMGEPNEMTKATGSEQKQTTKYKYNEAYELTELTDPNNHVTKYGYDAEGNRTSEKDANENETKWAYNSTHDLTSETTPKGEKTTITRNATGDPESIKRPAPESKTQETSFVWAENGDLKEEIDPLGRTTKYAYDKYGDREAETDPEGGKRTWGYDEDGKVTSEVSPRGNEAGKTPSEYETKIKRDAQGRPEIVTDPLGGETKYAYDANGNLKELTDPNGHATKYAYDADNERTEAKAANGDISKIAYDSEGNVESKTDGNSHTTKYVHNSLNQLTETIDPLERKTTRKYDAAGNLKELKDPESRTTTYSYDPGDRLKEVKYTEETTKPVSYAYDQDGNVTEMKDGTGTTKNTYDELDRLTESKNGNSELVKYKYDLGNETTEIVYPNSKAVTQSFDKAGRLESVKDWLGNETKFAYNADSLPAATTFPVATEDKDEYAYDRADRIESTTMKQGASTLASIAYSRTAAGQLKSATQTGLPGSGKPEYAYDERERLKEGAGTSFKYDPANNPTELGAIKLEYDEASELKKAGTTKYTYDTLGERTKAEPEGGTATTYGYDQAGNLTSVTKSGSIDDTYGYDGTGLRMSQKISGATTHMAWDTAEPLPLLLYDGTNYYLYGPEGLSFEQITGETVTYLHHDQQGSTRLITNASGEAKGKYTYTPYGAVEEHSGSASTPLGYDGQYRSEDTGLIYLRARVYDPETAQFMSVDPIVSQTEAPYFYAGDSPLNGSDPSGTCEKKDKTFCKGLKAKEAAEEKKKTDAFSRRNNAFKKIFSLKKSIKALKEENGDPEAIATLETELSKSIADHIKAVGEQKDAEKEIVKAQTEFEDYDCTQILLEK
jgi:RHS repeat-associated protein